MNILVTGANGQLGRCLQEVARSSQDRYIFTDVCEGYTHLDITDKEELLSVVKREAVECIVNCAAWTDVDRAETAGEIVGKLNSDAPQELARAMKEVGGLLIHISTDYVFGKERCNTPYTEQHQGAPTSVYGQTKLQGEKRIAAVGGEYIILRTAWLYSEYGRNFVKTMLALTAEKPQVKVVCDQCGTPTYAHDLAQAIVELITRRLYVGHNGIYNYSNEGVCSWFDFAKAIAAFAGREGEVVPCLSSEFPTVVERPAYSVLDKTKFKETFALSIPYWTDSLRRCISNILSKEEV